MTTREMVAHVAQALGRRAPRWHAPMWPFLAAAVTFEKTFSPLGIQPPLHRRRLDFFRKSFVFSTAKASRVLGFRASVPFAAGSRGDGELVPRPGPAGALSRDRPYAKCGDFLRHDAHLLAVQAENDFHARARAHR